MSKIKKPKLVKEWKKAYQISSIQIIMAAYAFDVIADAFGERLPLWVTGIFTTSAVIARLIVQKRLTDD